jgi:hypothetical protein
MGHKWERRLVPISGRIWGCKSGMSLKAENVLVWKIGLEKGGGDLLVTESVNGKVRRLCGGVRGLERR